MTTLKVNDFVKAEGVKGTWKIKSFETSQASGREMAVCKPCSNQPTLEGERTFPISKLELD